jgi:hypothetical protein
MLPTDGDAGSVTVTALDVVFTGYALPATAVKLPVWTDCKTAEPPYDELRMPTVLTPGAMLDKLRAFAIR